MTRILHLSMLYPPHIMGGAERSVALLAEAQVAAGHAVAAACISPTGWKEELRHGVRVWRMPHETDFWPEEWPQHSVLARGVRRFKQQFNHRIEAHFGRVIDEFKPDVVHTHSLLDVSTRVWLAARARGLPVVHTLRDFDLACGTAAMFRDGHRCATRCLECKGFTFMKARHHRAVDAVVGVGAGILQSHLDMGYFGHVPEGLRRVIWNPAVVEGVGADYVKPSLQGQPLTFGYLGRINVEKGVGTLLDAAARLPAGDWRVLIAGKEASEADSLKPRAAGLPVEFLGFVPPRELFERIDVLVVPSIWAEPLPRTILEAYAAGVPVIGADSGGIPDLIGAHNRDWLYAPGDDEGLARRMRRVLAQGREALPGREAFASVVQATTPEKVARRYLELYDEVRPQAAARGRRRAAPRAAGVSA
jgi:glycosyltransferase involved in cell wall biosynthesis